MQHDRRTPDEEEIEPRTGGGSPAMKCHHALRQAATGISSREEINVFPVPLFLVPQAVAGAIRRNKAISRTRSLVKRPFAWIKRVFEAGHLMVTTVARVRVKNTFSCIDFNLRQLLTLKAQPAERYLSRKSKKP